MMQLLPYLVGLSYIGLLAIVASAAVVGGYMTLAEEAAPEPRPRRRVFAAGRIVARESRDLEDSLRPADADGWLEHLGGECVGTWDVQGTTQDDLIVCRVCLASYYATSANRRAAVDENAAGDRLITLSRSVA